MPRKKKYNEDEVAEKAMHLLWKNGISNTSMRMLEHEMGINQFSIYSSFGDKQGLVLESMKCYRNKISNDLLAPLKSSNKGVEDIKTYFLNFIDFSKDLDSNKGCFMTNTVSEFGSKIDSFLKIEINRYATKVKNAFIEKLRINTSEGYNEKEIVRKANYLMVALQGISAASQILDEQSLIDFIDITFINLR